jgi:hypothetical protein
MVPDTHGLGFSLKFETYVAVADMRLLTSLPISVICQYVYQVGKSIGSDIKVKFITLMMSIKHISFFNWLYNPWWVLASLTTVLQTSLSA